MKVDLLKLFIEDLMTKAYHKKKELIVTPFVFRSQSSIWLIMTCNSATIYLKPRLTCTLSDMKNPICYLIDWILKGVLIHQIFCVVIPSRQGLPRNLQKWAFYCILVKNQTTR